MLIQESKTIRLGLSYEINTSKISEEQELENVFVVLADFAIDCFLAKRRKTEYPALPKGGGGL